MRTGLWCHLEQALPRLETTGDGDLWVATPYISLQAVQELARV